MNPRPCAVPLCVAPALDPHPLHLCERHRDYRVCPTCRFWRVLQRGSMLIPSAHRCPTCSGLGYTWEARALDAIARHVRNEERERPDIPGPVRDHVWREYGHGYDLDDPTPTPEELRRYFPELGHHGRAVEP